MKLKQFQHRFAASLFSDRASELSPNDHDYIKSTPELGSTDRVEIYRQGYWARLISSLRDDFPGLISLIGDQEFDRLVVAYLLDRPSTSFTLRNLGQYIESWLQSNRDFLENYQICSDMVQLEWAHIESFDAKEENPLTLADLQELNSSATFTLQPHIKLLSLHHPVDDILSDPDCAKSVLHEKSEAIFVAVFREDLSVYDLRLSEFEYALLKSMHEGESLENAIETTFIHSGLSAEKQAQILEKSFNDWARKGWLCRRKK